MDFVCEGMATFDGGVKVIVEIMDVHVAVAETAPRGNVKVAHHLVDADDALNTATFLPLCIQFLTVAFSLALLDALTTTE